MKGANDMKTAFTLIEILIVVILLGILAAIVVPQFADSKTTAQKNACKTNVKSLNTASTIYRLKEGETGLWNDLTGNTTYLPVAPVCELKNSSGTDTQYRINDTTKQWECDHVD